MRRGPGGAHLTRMDGTTLRSELLQQLESLLRGGQAHVGLEAAVAHMPYELQGVIPERLPYSAWQILEHLRIAQHDILEFSTNANGRGYQALDWPAAYWPKEPATADTNAWERTVAAIVADREAFLELLKDGDLLSPFAWGDGQTLLREALLIADHNAYHVGELIVVRRLLHAWPSR